VWRVAGTPSTSRTSASATATSGIPRCYAAAPGLSRCPHSHTYTGILANRKSTPWYMVAYPVPAISQALGDELLDDDRPVREIRELIDALNGRTAGARQEMAHYGMKATIIEVSAAELLKAWKGVLRPGSSRCTGVGSARSHDTRRDPALQREDGLRTRPGSATSAPRNADASHGGLEGRRVTCLACGDVEGQGSCIAVAGEMDFRAQAAAGASMIVLFGAVRSPSSTASAYGRCIRLRPQWRAARSGAYPRLTLAEKTPERTGHGRAIAHRSISDEFATRTDDCPGMRQQSNGVTMERQGVAWSLRLAGKVVMPVSADSKLSEAILAELDETEARFREVQMKARQQLSGEDDGGGGSTRCFRCSCPFYESPSSGHSVICSRSTCRHGFTSHDVF
jgi:hypothetical protein